MSVQHNTDVHESTVREVAITPQSNPDQKVFRATCDCGWVGMIMTDWIDADNDADEHVIEMGRAESDV
jgi:hypothetical protein